MRLGAVALVVGLVLDLGTGCGTSPSSTTGVVGKQNGAGGQSGDASVVADAGPDSGATGAAGASGDGVSGNTGYTNLPGGEMPSCSVIATQYANTIADAQVCDPNGSNQCQSLVPATLSACPVCMTFANVSVTLATIKADWDKVGCGGTPPATCPKLTCTTPASGSCSGGSCVSN